MTITSNIHVGLPAWASQTYATGNRVATGGNAYQCVGPGLSTAAPTGTFGAINNGGVATWRWLSTIDFTTVQAWVSSWPATLVDNMVGLLWNNGPITTTTGTSYMQASGHTMGAFTATLTCAPGESFRDSLRDNDYPLAVDPNRGVTFVLPIGVGNVNYINITDANVIVDGLQFLDPFPISNCSIWGTNPGATGSILQNCILDGYGQSGGAAIIQPSDGCTMATLLVIDRQAGGVQALGGPTVLVTPGTAAFRMANCQVVAPNLPTQAGVISTSTSAASVIRNTVCLGYSTSGTAFSSTAGTVTADHCVVDVSSFTAGSVTDGGGNVFGKTIAGEFPYVGGYSSGYSSGYAIGVNDWRALTTSNLLNAGVTDTTDIPSAVDIRGVHRPQGTNWDVGVWELVTAGPLPRPLALVYQEQPDQSGRLVSLRAGVTGTSVQLTAVLRSVVTRQEYPGHPYPTVFAGVTIQNVISSGRPYIITRQEAPRDSVPGPMFAGPPRWPNVATLGQVGRVVSPPQEQPVRPPGVLGTGPQGPNVAPPSLIRSVFVRQEQPPPTPLLAAAGPPQTPATVVGPPVTSSALLRQELPAQPLPTASAGPYGQLIVPPVTSRIVTTQQLPDHPLSVLRPSLAGPVVISSGRPNVFLRQEPPVHPGPVTTSGVPPTNPAPPGPIVGGTGAFLRQELPSQPLPVVSSGVQGPNVRVPVSDRVSTVQEQAVQLLPVTASGPYGQLVVPSPTSRTVTVQQQSDHPSSLLRFGPQGPNVRPPTADSIILRQEPPFHPPSLLSPSLPGASVLVKISDSVLLRQELPSHPLPIVAPSLPGSTVISGARPSVFVRQEQPSHSLPTIGQPPPGRAVAGPSLTGTIVLRQEQPGHPASVAMPGSSTTTTLPPTTRSVFIRQQQPDHPPPVARAGVFLNRKHVRGRFVQFLPS